jgi:hypothetical protein
MLLKDLDRQITKARKKVEVGGIYHHYKSPDKYYVIESIGFLENSEEVCVVYRALYGKGIVWVRTLDDFLEKVNGKKRFTRL